ncbi:hypothetical protein FOCG_17925 [Fusarium oxysporum f. sp. radicis-lycopersici 26381]|nr:hypothetical protein FOCG_17925 [Fusarium oxysporum f. sp. radicis-lycopersici 26381]
MCSLIDKDSTLGRRLPIVVTRLKLVSTEEMRNANVNIDGSFSPGCVDIYVL